MANGNSIINFGDLSKPATVFIEKISDAIGGLCKPFQIRRVAHAEADAEKIKAVTQAVTQIEISELQQRALRRFLAEEAKKQDNIESITAKALPQLENNAKPQEVDDDWITYFFDKCRLISDEEMQSLWARVLSGEANAPGSYSKRTINFLSSLDKLDATLFTALCGYGWHLGAPPLCPLVYDFEHSIYKGNGITFATLKHLDDIGLLSFDPLAGYKRIVFPKRVGFSYYEMPVNVEFSQDGSNDLAIGKVMLSKVGQELAVICASKPVPGFLDHVLNYWSARGITCSSPYNFTASYLNFIELKIISGNYVDALETSMKTESIFTALSDLSIYRYLQCIAMRLLEKDTSECESRLKEILEGDFKLRWSFDEVETWLKGAAVTEDKKEYITKLTELLKERRG